MLLALDFKKSQNEPYRFIIIDIQKLPMKMGDVKPVKIKIHRIRALHALNLEFPSELIIFFIETEELYYTFNSLLIIDYLYY